MSPLFFRCFSLLICWASIQRIITVAYKQKNEEAKNSNWNETRIDSASINALIYSKFSSFCHWAAATAATAIINYHLSCRFTLHISLSRMLLRSLLFHSQACERAHTHKFNTLCDNLLCFFLLQILFLLFGFFSSLSLSRYRTKWKWLCNWIKLVSNRYVGENESDSTPFHIQE